MFELLALICLSASWLVPNHYPPWTSFYNEACAALGLVLLVASLARSNVRQATPGSVWVLLAVGLVPWAQWLTGRLVFSGDAIVASSYVFFLAAAIACGHAWACRDARTAATRLSATVVAGSLLSSSIAIAQGFGFASFGLWAESSPGVGARAGANLAQPNNLALLIGLGLVGLLYLRERRRLPDGVVLIGALILLAGMTMTQSRTALLFGLTIALGWWVARRRGIPLATGPRLVIVAAVVQWAMAFAWQLLAGFLSPVKAEPLATRVGGSMRLEIWPTLLDATTLEPWGGYGWLQVGEAQLAIAERHPPAPEFWMHGHNFVLDLVLWCGYPLGLLLALLVLVWYVTRVRRIASTESLICMLSVTLLAIHALVELPHHYLYFLIPIGLWIGQVEVAPSARAPSSRIHVANLVALTLAVATGLLLGRDYGLVEDDFRLVRFENRNIGSLRASQPAPDAPFLSSLTAFLRFSRMEPREGMPDADIRFMMDVTKRYPYAPSLYRLARAQALNGRLADAERSLDQLRRLHGDGNLLRVRNDLRERVANGQSGLSALEQDVTAIASMPAIGRP